VIPLATADVADDWRDDLRKHPVEHPPRTQSPRRARCC